MNLFGGNKLAQLATCPGCQCDVSVWVAIAYRVAGAKRERVGSVLDCVRCGQRYTALDAGGAISYAGAARGVSAGPARAADPGGARDGAGATLIDDMVTDFTRAG